MSDHDSPWNPATRALWARIEAHPIGGAAAGAFRARLAREQGWTPAQADAAISEYRRFCFLAICSEVELTPSESVDAVWHLHLIHTRDYWQVFCPLVLGAALHHGPTPGRHAQPGYREAYALALARYEAFFGPSPECWWPAAAVRFAPPVATARYDPRRHWLLARPRWPRPLRRLAAALAALAPASASAQAWNPLDLGGSDFLALFAGAMLVAALASILLRRALKSMLGGPAGGGTQLDVWETAWLAGGAERVVDAGIAELHRRGLIEAPPGGKLAASASRERLEAPLDGVLDSITRDGRIASIVADAGRRMQPIHAALVRRGLWFDRAAAERIAAASALPWALLVLLGGARVALGIGRERPVVFIALLTGVCLLVAVLSFAVRPGRTPAGDATLRQLNLRHSSVCRAPRSEQLALAVALAGTAVLSGTALAGYHAARQPSSSGDGGSSSSSTDSSNDGDGGGSGCGGCGGGGGD
jgi:uncharacterized protein (TIGR04222 family)